MRELVLTRLPEWTAADRASLKSGHTLTATTWAFLADRRPGNWPAGTTPMRTGGATAVRFALGRIE